MISFYVILQNTEVKLPKLTEEILIKGLKLHKLRE